MGLPGWVLRCLGFETLAAGVDQRRKMPVSIRAARFPVWIKPTWSGPRFYVLETTEAVGHVQEHMGSGGQFQTSVGFAAFYGHECIGLCVYEGRAMRLVENAYKTRGWPLPPVQREPMQPYREFLKERRNELESRHDKTQNT
jgi:hypothetical protein